MAAPGRRVAAWFLDGVIAGIYIAPFLFAMFAVGDFDYPNFDLVAFYGFGIPAYLFAMGLLAYFDGSRRGQTPGKMILGIRVADAVDGGPIGFRRGLLRRLVYLGGGLLLYIGWLWGLWDRRRQTWHDKLAKSVVLRIR